MKHSMMVCGLLIIVCGVVFAAQCAPPQIKPLSQEEIGQVLESISQGKKVADDTLHRALISDQTYLRASAARLLGEGGDAASVPNLIAALGDPSVHEGAHYPDAGMATTRYWANASLKKLTKLDFGFVWNAPESERQAAIKGWQVWFQVSSDQIGEKSPITSPAMGTNSSPKDIEAAKLQGAATATKDIEAGVLRILEYGEPRPITEATKDEQTGYRIFPVAGCRVTAQIRAEADAYNQVMREWHAKNLKTAAPK